jgi:hypothetical protein
VTCTTVNGKVRFRRTVYWRSDWGTAAPLDDWLGLSEGRYSPGVREMVCRVGLDSSYRKAAADLRRLSQVVVSRQTFSELLSREGQRVRDRQQSGRLGATFTAADCRTRKTDPSCLITGSDGVQVPLITDGEKRTRRRGSRKRRAALRRRGHALRPLPPRSRGANHSWKEAKLVTFYDPAGRYRHTAATTGNHNVLGRLMRREAATLRLDRADRKYAVCDGADWIRNQYNRQLPMLDETILDYYHFREHAIDCQHALFGQNDDRGKHWRKDLCGTAIEAGPFDVLERLGDLRKTRRGAKRQSIENLQGYLAKRTDMIDYPRLLAEGYQIGSGPTESQCKCLTTRLKGRGRRWNRRSIDSHLALSCLWHSTNQWQNYWGNN